MLPPIAIVLERQLIQEQEAYPAERASARALAHIIHSTRFVVQAQDSGLSPSILLERAAGFALGVLSDPEYWAERAPPSLKILQAFGFAVLKYSTAKRAPLLRGRSHV